MTKISLKINFLDKLKSNLFPFYKSKNIKKIFKILNKYKRTDKDNVAMFVGGCVRKYLTNEVVDDIDIATSLSPSQIIKIFKLSDIKVVETGIKHGTLTLVSDSKKFEITTLRKDLKTFGRHADVVFTDDWRADSERRDFTINSIYLDDKGKIYDPQNGVEDLNLKVIRFIGDPKKRIEEDYLRILRFIRFSLQYDNVYSKKANINAIKLSLSGIKKLSKERILDELYKILKLKNFQNINKNEDLKYIFSSIFPEFKYLDRLNKLSDINMNILNMDHNEDLILLAILLDDKNNHEYFCHKYRCNNKTKDTLDLFYKIFIKYKSDKNFLNKNLKENIYIFGKKNIKIFSYFTYLENKKFTISKLKELNEDIESTETPKFPYSGKFLIKKGVSKGEKMGLILSELEKAWIKNNYQLSEERVQAIIKRSTN